MFYVNQCYAYMPVVLIEHVLFYIPSPDLLIIALHDDLLFVWSKNGACDTFCCVGSKECRDVETVVPAAHCAVEETVCKEILILTVHLGLNIMYIIKITSLLAEYDINL